jgi:hypothetical protein
MEGRHRKYQFDHYQQTDPRPFLCNLYSYFGFVVDSDCRRHKDSLEIPLEEHRIDRYRFFRRRQMRF